MEQVLGYAITAIIAWLIGKVPSMLKYGALAGELVDCIAKIRVAVKDKTVTEDEIKAISAEFKEVKEAYKKIKSK